MSNNDCLFCRIAAGEIPCQKVWESADLLAFRDLNPQAPTHLLVIPRKHLAALPDAGNEDGALLGALNLAAGQIARELGLQSFRWVANSGAEAGQSVFHLHFHLLAGRKMNWPPG